MIRTCANCHQPNTSGKPFLCASCAWEQWGRFSQVVGPAPAPVAQPEHRKPAKAGKRKKRPA